MTREEMALILAYCQAGSGCSKPVTDKTAEVYFDVLGDLPYEDVHRAARQALAESKYPTIPPVGVLRQLAGGGSGAPDDRATISYSAAARAVQNFGGYESVNFDDPVANAVIRNMGGWVRFCEWNPDETKWRERDFLRHYGALYRMGFAAELANPLAGICETSNKAIGYDRGWTGFTVRCGLPAPPAGTIRGELQKKIQVGPVRRLTHDDAVVESAADKTAVRKITVAAAKTLKDADSQKAIPASDPCTRPALTRREFEERKQDAIEDYREQLRIRRPRDADVDAEAVELVA